MAFLFSGPTFMAFFLNANFSPTDASFQHTRCHAGQVQSSFAASWIGSLIRDSPLSTSDKSDQMPNMKYLLVAE